MGWKGVCFEPNKKYHQGIKQYRSCTLVDSCVLGQPGNISFYGHGSALTIDKSVGGPVTATLSCVGILEEIERLGLRGRTIDMLTIDIEGAESSVLRCFPFSQIDVKVILIETNKKTVSHSVLDVFFTSHGYANVASLTNVGTPLDTVYAKLPTQLAFPPTKTTCSRADRAQNPWCGPFHPYYKYKSNNRVVADWDFSTCEATPSSAK